MRLRGLGRWLRQSTAFLRPQIGILLYHRVFEAPADPLSLCVSPQHFAEHLKHLRQHYQVLSLREFVRSLMDGHLPRRAVVLTFDDGYSDNLWNAKPLVERYELPAAVFVTAGYVGSGCEFWWDELERLVLLSPELPDRLHVTLNHTAHEWHLGKRARLPIAAGGSHRQWSLSLSDDPTPRHRAYRDLYWLVRPLGHKEREMVFEILRSQARSDGQGRAGYRALTVDEVRRLAAGGLVEIGAHTVTHPMLSAQPPNVQQWEMAESKRQLEAVLGRTVAAFCYPYGSWSDVGETAIQMARDVGFEIACAVVPRPVTRGENHFWLPRLPVEDWDGYEFARRLQGFFDG